MTPLLLFLSKISGTRYHEPSATDAHRRIAAFFRRHLSAGPRDLGRLARQAARSRRVNRYQAASRHAAANAAVALGPAMPKSPRSAPVAEA